ncbi:MAG TPA: glycosyltransferase family 87 protein, partial [Desulfobaccales bacterium]
MSWHEGERATVAVGLIAATISLGFFAALMLLSWDFTTLRAADGYPVAADYSNYWAAAKLALAGKPALIYHFDELHQVQQQVFGTHSRYSSGWYYPPTYLLVVLPLGLLPYLPSLLIWISSTLLLYLVVLSRISDHPVFLPLCLTFTGIGENMVFGQNGFLSGTLLGGGLLLMERLPLAAGCLFGLLSYKPHFIVLIVLALIIGRYWKVLMVTIGMSLLLVSLSLVVFGYHVWLEYFKIMSVPMSLLEKGLAPWIIMPTFFSAILSAGLGVKSAYLVQGVVMLAVAAGVAWVWSKKTSLASRGAVLVLGTLLFTPYAFIYDLAILALPLAWLWEDGRRHGRRPGELLLLLFGWLMPGAMPLLWN